MPGDIIVLHMRAINENRMMTYGPWDIEPNRIFLISNLFLPFYPPPNNPENQKLEKMKKTHLEISSFYTSVPKTMMICYNDP